MAPTSDKEMDNIMKGSTEYGRADFYIYSTRSKVFVEIQFHTKSGTFEPSTTHFARRQLDLKFRRSIEIQYIYPFYKESYS
jgi:hypothetical protein